MSTLRSYRARPRGLPPIPSLFLGALFLQFMVLCISGCSDDDPAEPSPETSDWTEVDLPAEYEGLAMLDIDFAGNYGLALGLIRADGGASPLVLEHTAGGWTEKSIPDMPAYAVLIDVDVVSEGVGVMVGYTLDGGPPCPLIVDLRQSPAVTVLESRASAVLNAVVVGKDIARAVGVADGGLSVVSNSGGPWKVESLPFDDSAEKGLTDIVFDGERFLSCGFDDGGEPYRLVLSHNGESWTTVPVPGTNRDLEAIWPTGDGGFFVGGTEPDGSAFLASYDPGPAEWTELVLPEAERLGEVHDILRTADGALVLACGTGDRGAIVRDSEIEYELAGELFGLAEDGDGTLWAVGGEVGGSSYRPVFLRRRP